MDYENEGKGIWWQMQNAYKTELPKNITLKDLEEASAYYTAMRAENNKELKERTFKNLKHLDDRAKILGKPIPTVLLVIAHSNTPITSKFCEECKEWF